MASSFANACMVASQTGAQQESTASGTLLLPAPGEKDHCSAGDGPGALKTHCEDFCDKSTISIPPLKLAVDHADASAAQPPVAMVFAAAAPEPALCRLAHQDGGHAPPCSIAIAFLRLAL